MAMGERDEPLGVETADGGADYRLGPSTRDRWAQAGEKQFEGGVAGLTR